VIFFRNDANFLLQVLPKRLECLYTIHPKRMLLGNVLIGGSMFTSIAYAAAGAPGGGTADGAGGLISMFMPLILMFAVFYFLLIRPQQKKAKAHKEMLRQLQKGDFILTTGGLLGRILDIEGDIFTIDLGDSKVRTPRAYISGTYDPKQITELSNSTPNNAK